MITLRNDAVVRFLLPPLPPGEPRGLAAPRAPTPVYRDPVMHSPAQPAPSGRGHEAALRRCVLAASLVYDVDALAGEEGVRVGGEYGPVVPWSALTRVADDPESTDTRHRIGRLLLGVRALDELLATDGWTQLESRLRAVALPRTHAEHPGPGWRRGRVHGDVLDLGVGVQGLLGDPDRTDPLPPAAALIWGRRLHRLLDDEWDSCLDHLERMGQLAVARLARDRHRAGDTTGVLRPVGGCDVMSLLAARALRRWLADGDGTGMRAVAVPMRDRGWFDLTRIDPAFVGAAYMATDDPARGLPAAVLVTADEVALAPAEGDPASAPGIDLPRR